MRVLLLALLSSFTPSKPVAINDLQCRGEWKCRAYEIRKVCDRTEYPLNSVTPCGARAKVEHICVSATFTCL